MSSNLIFSSPSMDQRFPSDIYKYLKQNVPPSKILKLMQICKYFQYQKFPFNVFQYGLYVLLDKKSGYFNKWKYDFVHHDFRIQDLELVELSNNLWIEKIFICEHDSDLMPAIVPKVAYFDIQRLVLAKQNISFDEFKFLTAGEKIIEIFLTKTFIEKENGNLILGEDLFECLPLVEKIVIKDIIPLIGSMDAVMKSCSLKLRHLKLKRIPETSFNISTMIELMHRYSSYSETVPGTKYYGFDFVFNDDLSLAFIEELQKSVDELGRIWEYEFGHFHFVFKKFNEESQNIITKGYCNQYCKRWRCFSGCCKAENWCECGFTYSPIHFSQDEEEDSNDLYDNVITPSENSGIYNEDMPNPETLHTHKDDNYSSIDMEVDRVEEQMKKINMKRILTRKKKIRF